MLFKKKKISQKELIKLYKETFSTPSGERVLIDICNRFYMMSSTMGQDDSDKKIYYREGARNVALFLLKMVNYDFEKFLDQREENKLEVQYD